MVGQQLGGYRLVEEIGRGGMGVVYRAVQETLNRVVAVKVLAPHLVASPEFVERFLREARAAAHLEHPGIVTIYDVGQQDGIYYFAMQLMPGMTLDQVVRSAGCLDAAQAAGVGVQIADALAYAHREGICHRDIKPANILIDRSGRCVLTDFGIAWAASETRLTATGTSLGSPDYMAPEAIQGQPTDGRSDLYSLGVLLFQVLSGQVPFKGETAVAVSYQHVNTPVPQVLERNPAVPVELNDIVFRLMAKRPEERFQQAEEVRDELWRITGGMIPALDGAAGSVTAMPTPTPLAQSSAVATEPAPPRRSLAGLGLLLSVLGLLLVGGVYFAMVRPFDTTPARSGGGGPPPGTPGAPATVSAAEASVGGAPVEAISESAPGVPDSTLPDPGGAVGTARSHVLQIDSDPPGAEIWVDGVDRHLVTPAAVEIAGAEGQEVQIALVRDGATLSSRRLVVGPDFPERWQAGLVQTETFTITSQPAGATVFLSGERLPTPTPVSVELSPDRTYELRIERDGYKASGMSLQLEQLSASMRESGQLHFPLQPAVPPGLLAARAAYPLTLDVGGRRIEVAAGADPLKLKPGSYEVGISAPSVYYASRASIEIRSGEETALRLPRAVRVTVAATPGRCRVSIDGREVDYVPFEVDLAVGEHTFVFRWDGLGESRTVRHDITAATRRVFEAAGAS